MEAEMTLRPMTVTERMYSYTQSQQLIMQSGCIGHLSANFGSDNKHFNTSWDDHRADLKSGDFEHEFEEVIKALREDDKYGAVFKNRGALLSLCSRTPESSFGNDREYGFRADTDHYSYLFRLNPSKGTDNIICYCYLRQWLDRHMRQAERGIRFITPDYKELFRIADGDKIRYYTPGGAVRLLTCRYIDDYHFETGNAPWSNLYHICEFAEKYQNHGCTGLTPLRNSLPEKSFAHLESTGAIVIIVKGEKGYLPTANYPVDCDPKESVAVKEDAEKNAEVKESISKLSSQLATLRREVKLCNDIALRSGIILEHIQMEKAKEQSVRKEKTDHEQRRRCSGTNR